jgi:CheY-like chemotaxis protein
MSATILVVDDNPVSLTPVEQRLAGGYRVWTARGAAEARQLLQDLAGAVDLVLTDIAMPGGLGTDLARQIGSTQGWARILPGPTPGTDPGGTCDVTAPIILEIPDSHGPPDSERRKWMQERQCVIVGGFARSGTSWLAKSLSFARGFTYYREPDNVK